MYEKIMKKITENNIYYWLFFMAKTIFYTAIIFGLLYLYKHLEISGGNFIYNEF